MSMLKQWQTDFQNTLLSMNDNGFGQQVIDDGIASERRLNIYRNNIFQNHTSALKATYPVIYKLVGGDYFNYLAKKYSTAHPSLSGNLHDFGQNLSLLLENLPELTDLKYLPQVARLEWSYHSAFHAEEAAMLDLSRLRDFPGELIDEVVFTLHPSARLLHFTYPVLQIWLANQHAPIDEQQITLAQKDEFILVIRKQLDIEFQQITKTEFHFLKAIDTGQAFRHVCDQLLQQDSDIDIARLLAEQVQNSSISDFYHPHHTSKVPA